MDAPRTVPVVSPAPAEEISLINPPLNRVSNREPLSCCVGADVPGVGRTHLSSCPLSRFTLPANEGASGEVPPALRRLLDQEQAHVDPRKAKREGLLARLIFAARNLASDNLIESGSLGFIGGREIRTAGCRECYGPQERGAVHHAATCKTGDVMATLAELCAVAQLPAHASERADGLVMAIGLDGPVMVCPECRRVGEVGSVLHHTTGCSLWPGVFKNSLQSTEKEAAPAEESHGGAWERPRGLAQRVCLKCGKQDENWIKEVKPEDEVYLAALDLNQCVGAGPEQHGHTLYTHVCAERSGRGVDALFAQTGGAA